MKTVTVELGARRYPILIGEGALAELGEQVKQCTAAKRAFVVSDDAVAEHWLHPALNALQAADIDVQPFVIAPGEASKSFPSLQGLLEEMLDAKPDRKTVLVAVGGGVVGDLVGCAASLLLRGVPFVQVPTTLLAMVDSSVGGKTGINTLHGKNLIGSFYQPRLVLADTATLATLPEREQRAGFAEVIKYGCIQDAAFFDWLEQNGMNDLPTAIEKSCQSKAAIVGADEREESGQRALLNFGHSFGHALEAECGYDGTLLHGEAVAIGMVMAADLSAQMGLCAEEVPARIHALLKQSGLPTRPRDIRAQWDAEALLARMAQDKKVEAGQLRLILLSGIGDAILSSQASADQLRDLWKDYTG